MDPGTARTVGRDARAALSPETRRAGSAAIHDALETIPEFQGIRNLAGYWPMVDEVDLRGLWTDLHERGVRVHLPRIGTGAATSMDFVVWDPADPMEPNRFGVPEPRGRACTDPSALDIVVLPCVAVDDHGARVGMGKGFYDRTLAGTAGAPLLVGVAFDCQRIHPPEHIRTAAWDVNLDVVVTDAVVRRPRRDRMP